MIVGRVLLAASMLAVASPASAHVGQGLGFSIAGGFAHPFFGFDHLVAMVAVGLWAALAGGKRLWVWPAAFVSAMLMGGFIGHAGIELPHVEPAIAASVIALGLLVATGLKAPVPLGAALIAAFAIFHGHAHGAEAPAEGWAGYAAGFVLATAMLHSIGIGVGTGFQRGIGTLPVRALGVATALFGVFILVS
jgi:urease accessory protein